MAGRILVLDDEENYAEMLQELLREHNYRVDMATRPERAIEQLEEIPYDLVISDYKMPVMDGADFLKRARELYPNLPFILVSGLMNTPELVKVANMSVTLVMEKPLDTVVFLQHVSRFSEPMSDADKLALAGQEDESAASTLALSYPEEPRYFSAVSSASKRFMQKAWALSKDGPYLFLSEPEGGEAELVVKDLSHWLGNEDREVQILDFSEVASDVNTAIAEICTQSENSHLVAIRLNGSRDIQAALEFAHCFQPKFDNQLLVFIITHPASEATVYAEIDAKCISIPALWYRHSDVAVYIRRFVRIAAERHEKPLLTDLSPEVVFMFLAYEWKSYSQMRDLIMLMVTAGDNEALSAETVAQNLELSDQSLPPASGRLASLLKLTQEYYLKEALSSADSTAAELSKKLDLGADVQTKDDLFGLPLVKAGLAEL